MSNIEIINKLLYDYEILGEEEVKKFCSLLPRKLVRWLGAQHADNRTRKIFYELTGVKIGKGTVLNINFIVSDNYESLLEIGENCAISPNVTVICDSNPNNSSLNNNSFIKEKLITTKHVNIEDNVWIGAGVVILPGVTIGSGSIIGAGAVVSKSIPPNVIATGIPAKIIRQL